MKKGLYVIAAAILLLAASGTLLAYRGSLKDAMAARLRPSLPVARPYQPPTEPSQAAAATATAPTPAPKTPPPIVKKPVTAVASGANLAVPFVSQAPYGNWSMPYQEACEEASLIMVDAYISGMSSLSPAEADRRILEVVDWEMKHFGYYKDTTSAEVATIAKEKYGYAHARVVPLGSIEDVKRQIDAGKAVLLPSAGRLLHNPYFSGAGPLYHMLVAKGYTKDGTIIVNDPGTRRGADYLYAPATLWNAIHDWNGGDVEHGAKVMIVVEK